MKWFKFIKYRIKQYLKTSEHFYVSADICGCMTTFDRDKRMNTTYYCKKHGEWMKGAENDPVTKKTRKNNKKGAV